MKLGEQKLPKLSQPSIGCSTQSHSVPEKNLRNIGIMAHIDAGKTTTTERMLYYSGRIRDVGEVHDGDTVTDYMSEERARGITITSAAISFPWRNNHINLIDTPGHVDFTVEVERALRVLDGAVAVFDASAGVEAQSLTVWRQADRYDVPRMCYLNKMDKTNADVKLCLNSIEEKLNTKPFVVQKPIGLGHSFIGVIDIISMVKMEWDRSRKDLGRTFTATELTPADGELYENVLLERCELADRISEYDDMVAQEIIEKESSEHIPSHILKNALRRITIRSQGVPLVMGSSYKNVGVQPLLDAINSYLPSPLERVHNALSPFKSKLCGIVFKIIHHPSLGVLTFLRIYSGSITKGDKIYNVNRKTAEKPLKILIPYADEFEDIEVANLGSIVVLTGLKSTITGDTLTSTELAGASRREPDNFTLMGVSIPEPVFMCSIEAPSAAAEKKLEESLIKLQREDPSLRVKQDADTAQTVLSGMGELHLEIIRNRIRSEDKIDVDLGTLEVSYRESLADTEPHTFVFDKTIIGEPQHVTITLQLLYKPGHIFSKATPKYTKDHQENLESIRQYQWKAINRGIIGALSTGPILGYPVVDVECKVLYCHSSRRTADTSISTAASRCIAEMLHQNKCFLLEPYMNIELATPQSKTDTLLGDLSKRSGKINSTDMRGQLTIIKAECPLSELVGYSSAVRMLSSGLASLTMEFGCYRITTPEQQYEIIKKINPFSKYL